MPHLGIVPLGALLLIAAIPKEAVSKESFGNRVILYDNSMSLPEEVRPALLKNIQDEGSKWIRTAYPGDRFSLWWFSGENSKYDAEHKNWEMPFLKVPAHRHRAVLERELRTWIQDVLKSIPPAKSSPILEALYFCGASQSNTWDLLLVSDLVQDSAAWNKGAKDKDQLKTMYSICGTVDIPPRRVMIHTWPGIEKDGKANVRKHQELKSLYRSFFEEWCPGTVLQIVAMD